MNGTSFYKGLELFLLLVPFGCVVHSSSACLPPHAFFCGSTVAGRSRSVLDFSIVISLGFDVIIAIPLHICSLSLF